MTSYLNYDNRSNQNKILNLTREIRDRKNELGIKHSLVAESLNALALTYHHTMNDHETAMQMHCEARHILEAQEQSQQNLIELAITIGDIGNCFWKKGDYESARNQYMRSLQFFENCQICRNHPKAKLCMYTMQYRLSQLQSTTLLQSDNQMRQVSSLSLRTTTVPPSRFIPAISSNKVHQTQKPNNNNVFPTLTLHRPTNKITPKNALKTLAHRKKSFEKNRSFTLLLRHRSSNLCHYKTKSLSTSLSRMSFTM